MSSSRKQPPVDNHSAVREDPHFHRTVQSSTVNGRNETRKTSVKSQILFEDLENYTEFRNAPPLYSKHKQHDFIMLTASHKNHYKQKQQLFRAPKLLPNFRHTSPHTRILVTTKHTALRGAALRNQSYSYVARACACTKNTHHSAPAAAAAAAADPRERPSADAAESK